jgi:prepilin-type N-terminal cleavage/methylation domain-containing protein
MSALVHDGFADDGFSLLEVTVAITILSIGLVSAALLTSKLTGQGETSKYMSLAATLASEKLEDLNRWDSDNPQLCIPTGSTTVGSLTTDVLQTTTCPSGSSGTVNYYDDVSLALNSNSDCPGSSAGCFAETVSTISGGNTQYTTTYHSPDGTITSTTATTAPNSTFHRRWIIEGNPVIGGLALSCPASGPSTCLRRITVLVTLLDQSVQTTETFQMSTVRP